ncbi:hypothetical protein CHS0354_003661 [Potamilus streckersoni]|uniref:Zinc transporter n=1 Tax=Potamilus streckersoni TaxID=2493646 RepID=A0AAE0VRI2_9BIVA|nr:hypothetical protein CHS0354_003661 [Potamilus streckersoni]
MAQTRALLKGLVFAILITMNYGKIHRVKTTSTKFGRQNSRYPEELDSSSYVAELDATVKDSADSDRVMLDETAQTRFAIWTNSVGCAILVGLSGIFPLLIIPIEAGPALKHGAAAAKLRLLLSFAVGGLLGDVFLHLLPEAWEHVDKDGHQNGHVNIGLWVLAGILSFLIIEKIFAKEGEFEHLPDECEEESTTCKENSNVVTKIVQNGTSGLARTRKGKGGEKSIKHSSVTNINTSSKTNTKDTTNINGNVSESKEESIKVSGYLNLAANVIDNFTHGLAVAGGFLVNTKVGLITTVAILLHEIPHEVGDFAILLRAGFDRWKAAKAQLLTATGSVFGAVAALSADSAQSAGDSTAWILPFTSGGFIYIALVTVVPDLMDEKHVSESVKQVVTMLLGIFAMYCVCLVH